MFQRKMVLLFGDISGVLVYFDDICITGDTQKEHDEALAVVVERARTNGIRFKGSKIQYRTNKIKFMGHFVVDGRVEPSDKYIRVITDMPKPSNKSEVLRLFVCLLFCC